MDFAQRLSDTVAYEAWRREAFPFFAHKIFLTHASVSPLPRLAATAIGDYAGRIAEAGQFDFVHAAIYDRCKERLARLVGSGAEAGQIALAGSTSHAIGLVATGLDWKAGDNCVLADGDFPANVVPWKNLRHSHDIEVRLIPRRPAMDLGLEDIVPLLDARTRIVSLASSNFLSGYPIDLASIGASLRERGILFCVDAIQTLGAIRFDARYVDFVCADAHKWMLGPNGIALLWARPEAMQQLRPAILGWLASQDRDHWYAYDTTPHPTAERFEPGARNYLGVVGMEASLGLIEETGTELVEQRVTALRDLAAGRLIEAGCRLLWIPTPERRAGIVSFRPKSGDAEALYRHLDEKFALSLRQDPEGLAWIRVSPHFMNTDEDIYRLVEAVEEFGA